MENNLDMGREFGWDEVIEHDSEEFELLPEGDYDFEVLSFERGRHNGSEKLPPCNKAILKIRVTGNGKTSTITHNLMLHSKTEGLICAFFVGIGQRKRGEQLRMDWNKVPGSKGRCKVGIRTFKSNKTGEEMKSNEIKRFYDPAETRSTPAPAAPAASTTQQAPQQTSFGSGFGGGFGGFSGGFGKR